MQKIAPILIILINNDRLLSEIAVIFCWIAIELGIRLRSITFELVTLRNDGAIISMWMNKIIVIFSWITFRNEVDLRVIKITLDLTMVTINKNIGFC